MKQVVVVIPVYTEDLTSFERVSLAQVRKVLGRYDICFMAPDRMRTFLEGHGARAEYWPDACFADRRGYSKLLLTPEFYERFSTYEYLLLYQLDAFVFSDRLAEFCEMGYDYIGAPMPYWSGWPYGLNHVGNGGLALRRIVGNILDQDIKEIFNARATEVYRKAILAGEHGKIKCCSTCFETVPLTK